MDTGADTPVNGWGVEVVCTGGGGYAASGVTGDNGGGTVKFSLPSDVTDCTVTEATDILVIPLGYVLDGGDHQAGTSATFSVHPDGFAGEHTVDFLNDPIELPPPATPPPGGPPPPSITTAEPTEPVVVETPEPTPEPTAEADEPEPIVEPTPITPDSGSGLAASSGNSATAMFMAAAALIALGGAVGTFPLARKRD